MTRPCALAEFAPSNAGAVTAAAPLLISVRRFLLFPFIWSPSLFAPPRRPDGVHVPLLLGVVLPRLFQMLQNLGPQRRLFLGAPLAEALAALEAELTIGDQPLQIGRRAGTVIDIRQN